MAVNRRGGRKRLPDQTKKLKGTLRKHRHAQGAEPDGQKPVVPGSISPRAQQLMDRLMSYAGELDYIDSHHGDVFMLLALRLEQVETNYAFLRKNGRTFTTTSANGSRMIRPRPEVAMYDQALRHAHSLLVEIGLTPSAMSRILRAGKKAPPSGEWDEF